MSWNQSSSTENASNSVRNEVEFVESCKISAKNRWNWMRIWRISMRNERNRMGIGWKPVEFNQKLTKSDGNCTNSAQFNKNLTKFNEKWNEIELEPRRKPAEFDEQRTKSDEIDGNYTEISRISTETYEIGWELHRNQRNSMKNGRNQIGIGWEPIEFNQKRTKSDEIDGNRTEINEIQLKLNEIGRERFENRWNSIRI